MGKAIVFKGVSFQANALEQITFVEPNPCTGLTLNKNAVTFECFGDTDTIVATPTPSNTTDQVTWTTSNANVATVSDGVITLKGLGEATITARCGRVTATITVTQESAKVKSIFKLANTLCTRRSAEVPTMVLYGTSSNINLIGAPYDADNTLCHMEGGVDRGIQCIPVAYGATKLVIKTGNGTVPHIRYMYGDPVNRTEHGAKSWVTWLGETSTVLATDLPSPTVGTVIVLDCRVTEEFDAITDVSFSK